MTKSSSTELDFERIFKELDSERIKYLVVGGLAVNMHGVPRMTYDIDLLIRLDRGNILKILSKIKEWGYLPRAPVDPEDLADEEKRKFWIRDKNLTAFSFYSENQPIGEIDLIIDSPLPYDDLVERARVFEFGEVTVPVISVNDLIELKRNSGRKQDLSDIEHLRLLLEK